MISIPSVLTWGALLLLSNTIAIELILDNSPTPQAARTTRVVHAALMCLISITTLLIMVGYGIGIHYVP